MLQQTFFIGNGKSSNMTSQRFNIPDGATRLYLGFVDGWYYEGDPGYLDNNTGSVNVTAIKHY